MIKALGEVPEDLLTPEFISSAQDLTASMSAEDKVKIITALRTVPAERLNQILKMTQNFMSKDRGGAQKAKIMQVQVLGTSRQGDFIDM
tara:strand:+ start:313 stop:579 length:267 start_codon:yes stop_codon:yes gene_type:complete